MTFEEIAELRDRGAAELTDTQAAQLLYEVWHLRIVIDVLRVTLKCWRVMYGSNAKDHDWLVSQDAAATEALKTVED